MKDLKVIGDHIAAILAASSITLATIAQILSIIAQVVSIAAGLCAIAWYYYRWRKERK